MFAITLKRFKTIGIVGGNGFLGKNLAHRLATSFDQVIVGVRSPKEFQSPFKNISVMETDITNENSLIPLVEKSDVVINTTNLIFESEHSYVDVLIEGTKNLAWQTRKQGKQYIHFSSMGTRLEDISYWGDLKYRGEDMAYASQPDCVILKPNLIIDARNNFFGTLCRRMTLGPLSIAFGGRMKVQPTNFEDVYQVVCKVIQNDVKGKVYEIAGKNPMTFQQAVKEQLRVMGKNPMVFRLPLVLGDSLVAFTQFLPNPCVTREVVSMLRNHILDGEFKESYQNVWKDLDMKPCQ